MVQRVWLVCLMSLVWSTESHAAVNMAQYNFCDFNTYNLAEEALELTSVSTKSHFFRNSDPVTGYTGAKLVRVEGLADYRKLFVQKDANDVGIGYIGNEYFSYQVFELLRSYLLKKTASNSALIAKSLLEGVIFSPIYLVHTKTPEGKSQVSSLSEYIPFGKTTIPIQDLFTGNMPRILDFIYLWDILIGNPGREISLIIGPRGGIQANLQNFLYLNGQVIIHGHGNAFQETAGGSILQVMPQFIGNMGADRDSFNKLRDMFFEIDVGQEQIRKIPAYLGDVTVRKNNCLRFKEIMQSNQYFLPIIRYLRDQVKLVFKVKFKRTPEDNPDNSSNGVESSFTLISEEQYKSFIEKANAMLDFASMRCN